MQGSAPPPPSPSTYAALSGQMKGLPSPGAAFTRPELSGQQPNFSKPSPGQVPVNEPVINPPDPGRYTQLPSWYSGFEPGKDNGGYSFSNPTPDKTFIENIPGTPGQMVVDRSQPGALIKSNRAYTPEEDFQVLGGRSSKLYQIDHIIPLWAGGADTPANKEVLTNNLHQQKTDAQAVPLTLLAHGKITPTLARSMALSWKEKDLTDLPDSTPGNGLISLADAEKVADRWNKQMTGPMSFMDEMKKAGGGSALKGFFNSIPEGTASVVHALGNVGKGYIPDAAQDVVGGLLEGGASGLTGGWASAQDVNPSTTREISNLVGNIGGMLIPVGLISRGLGWSARGIKGISVLSKAAAAKNGFAVAEEGASALEGAAIDASTNVGASELARPNYLTRLGGLSGVAARGAVPGFVAYGQLGPRGLAGSITGQPDAHPWEQFFSDLAFGVAAGSIPPTIKGRASMAVLPLITGPMFDPNHPGNWLVNAGVMFSLHGMGGRDRLQASDQAMQEYTSSVSRYAMNNVLHPYAGDSIPLSKTNADLPVFHTGDQPTDDAMAGQINTWTQNALSSLYKAASGKEDIGGFRPEDIKNMDYADWQTEAKKIVSAGRHLYKQTLDPVARAEEDSKDIMSVATMVKRDPQVPNRPINEPAVVSTAKDSMDQSYMEKSLKQFDKETPSGQNPTGTVALTGLASNVNANIDKVQYYFDMKAKGQASPMIFLVDRPDTAPFWRNLNISYTPDDIATKKVTPFAHPENAVQSFGIVNGDNGREAVPLGWVSRKSRINERLDNWNSHDAVKNGVYPPFDPNFNKDSISEHMRKNNMRVLMANIDDGAYGPRATVTGATAHTKSSNEPFIPVTINDHNWSESQNLNSKMSEGGTSAKEGMSELLGQANSGVNGLQQQAAIKEIANRTEQPAAEVLTQVPTTHAGDPVYRDATQGLLREAQASIEGNSPEEISRLFAEKMGVVLDENTAKEIFQNKNTLTSRDVFKIIQNANDSGWVMDGTRQSLDYLVKPFFNSPDFQTWPMAKAFPDLKISGGVKGSKPPLGKLVQSTMPLEAPTSPVETRNAPEQVEGAQMAPEAPKGPISPLATKMVAKAAELPIENISSVQNTNNRMSLMTQPTKTFGAGKQSFRLPTGLANVGDQVGFGPLKDAEGNIGARQYATLDSSEATQLPQSQDVQQAASVTPIKDASNELYARASEIMDSIDPVYFTKEGQERGGASAYGAALMNVIKKVQPGPGAGAKGTDIKTAISKQLVRDASLKIKNAFDASTDEYGQTVPMTFEEADNIMAKLSGGAEKLSKEKTPQGWRQFQQTLKDNPESIGAPSEKKTPDTAPKEDFFQKDPFSKVSGYDILKARREKAGKDLVDFIDFGKSAQPESYLHAFSYGMDKGLTSMFGQDYKSPEIIQLLGRSFGTEGRAARKMTELYQTENMSKEMKPISQSKDYLEAMGRGSRLGMKSAENARMKEVAQEQSNSTKQYNEGGLSSDKTMSDSISEMLGSGDMRISPSTQVEGKDIGLTRADTALMPGLTSILSGKNTEISPGEFQVSELSDTGPDAARRGIEDARNMLQFILNVHNESATSAQKFGSSGSTKKIGSSYLQLTGKKQYTGKWAGLTAKERDAVQSQTDTHFENLHKEYLNSVGADVGTKFAGVKKAVAGKQ
jgi:hypothetical protein